MEFKLSQIFTRGLLVAALGLASASASAAIDNTAYGILAYSLDYSKWANNIVAFDLESDVEPVFRQAVPYYDTSTAGAYAEDAYYVAATTTSGSKELPSALLKMDIEAGTYTTVGPLTGYVNIINDMTYDHSTGKMFAISRLNDEVSALFTIDLATATSTKIADLDRKFFTLACSYSGELYAISFWGEFCEIDKETGAVIHIGHTGYYPESFQSMAFDHGTHTLYWVASVRTLNESGTIELSETFLGIVDTGTGGVTRLQNFGDTQLAGLYIPSYAAPDNCPSPVKDLTATPADGGALQATLKWTNPSTTFGGDLLKSISKVEILRDGTLVGSLSNCTPGAVSTYTDVLGASDGGFHTWTVVPYNNNGAGVKATAKVFAGPDVPAAVTGLMATRTSPCEAFIEWDAVSSGAHGGWTDVNNTTYTVTRNPGAVVLVSGLNATYYTDASVDVAGAYSYSITATNSCGTSAPVESDAITLGPSMSVPYACEFGDDYGQWTAVDGNADGNTWKKNTITWAKAEGAYFEAINYPGDDWLVSNAFTLKPATEYRITIKGLAYGEHPLKFYLLKDFDTSAPVAELAELTMTRAFELGTYTVLFTTPANLDGDCNIAIHDTAAKGNSYVIFDRLEIEMLAANNLAATALTGNPNPVEGNTYAYTATVLNRGTAACPAFSVEIIDDKGAALASTAISEPLAAGASVDVVIDLAVSGLNTATLRARTVYAADQIADDDISPELAITVLPIGSPEEITIGKKTGQSYYHPMNLYSKYGASLNIYSASEMSVKRGRITGMSYDYSGMSALNNVEVKVYMANTTRTKASDGWLPESDMQLVYSGSVNLSKGAGKLDLTFQSAFEYAGGNLAVVVATSLANAGTAYSYLTQPYYASPLAGNSAVSYGSSTEPFAFSGTPTIRTGNSVVSFMVQSGGAKVYGIIVDENGSPLEGAKVCLEEIRAEALTDAGGHFSFDFVPNGNYTIGALLFGYSDAEKIYFDVNDYDREIALSLHSILRHSISGRVLAPDNTPVGWAEIGLSGYTDLATTTDFDGTFSFDDVVSYESTSITVKKEWYVSESREFDLNADIALGDITLDYAHYSPGAMYVYGGDKNMHFHWINPGEVATQQYDSGVCDSQLGITDEIGTVVMGTVFRTPMQLESVQWYTTEEGGPHHIINLYVYDLDANGDPTGIILYSERSIRSVDLEWNSYTLPTPVDAPHGCMVAINYPGFLGIGIDNGSKEYPFRPNTYAFSTNYNSGEFMYLDNMGLSTNLMIRADGRVYAPDALVAPKTHRPGIYSFKVFRSAGYDNDEWIEINKGWDVGFDLEWSSLPAGVYRYGVASSFPDGSMSKIVPSNYIAHQMYTDFMVDIFTNSANTSAHGASFKLEGRSDTYTATAGYSGRIELSDVWRDNYELTVTLPGYTPAKMTLDLTDISAPTYMVITLAEIIAKPVNLAVVPEEDGSFKFTWNESGEIFDGFEDHVPFTKESPGEVGWQYADYDGWRTFAESTFDFPGRTQPGSFMVFNPSLTSPSMYDQRKASHAYEGSAELACFAAVWGNNDWFISPRLTYHTPFTFSFFARGYSLTYAEYIKVGYSTEDTSPDSFTWLSDIIEVPMQIWTKYEFTVPAEARYVAINCISDDGFTLFIDNVAISSGSGMPMNTAVTGPEVEYHVAVDGTTVAVVEDCFTTLENVGAGTHTASVTAVYTSGRSETASILFGTDGLGSPAAAKLTVTPSADGRTIDIDGAYSQAILTDVSGRTIAVFSDNAPSLDLSHLTAGVYLISVQSPAAEVINLKIRVK